jgi:hypothetical protein
LETDPPGKQFLHHSLLELAELFAAGFEGCDLGVYVREDCCDDALFHWFWEWNFLIDDAATANAELG